MTVVFPEVSCDMLLVVATSAESANGAIVGRRLIDVTIAPTETDS